MAMKRHERALYQEALARGLDGDDAWEYVCQQRDA